MTEKKRHASFGDASLQSRSGLRLRATTSPCGLCALALALTALAPACSSGKRGELILSDRRPGTTAYEQTGGARPLQESGPLSNRYPASPTPWALVELQELNASDAVAREEFGHALAYDGETAVIGALRADTHALRTGAVYVFGRAAELWKETQKLSASDGASNDSLGHSVAVSGGVIAVGAPESDAVQTDAGAAYVYQRSAGVWSESQQLTASDAGISQRFGSSIALRGDLLVIGARSATGQQASTGAAYVFERSANAFAETQQIAASDGAPGDRFGWSLALSTDAILVAAPLFDAVETNSGAAYLFQRSANAWPKRETQRFVPSDAPASAWFGGSVALEGDVAAVGAHGHDGLGTSSGAAYLYQRNGATWPAIETKRLAPSSSKPAGDHFGQALALDGDMLLVGANRSDGLADNTGAVYVFGRSAGSWSEGQSLAASEGAQYDDFGWHLALHAGVAFIGARYDNSAGLNSGAAYVAELRLVQGSSCASDSECVSLMCVSGFCCDARCSGACEACDLVGDEGMCGLLPQAASPQTSCSGYLCNGDRSDCPATCTGDGDCAPDHHCGPQATCVPKTGNGATCTAGNMCSSGHCIDRLCCSEACDAGCGTCAAPGSEGVCQPLAHGDAGTPTCAPYFCDGAGVTCPSSCADGNDCLPSSYCADGTCQASADHGARCAADEACASGHCTDEVCCLASSCGAYRCGAAGACELSCRSSAQCSAGYQCTSQGMCEAQPGSATEAGGCRLNPSRAPAAPSAWWLLFLTALGVRARRRRARTCPPNPEERRAAIYTTMRLK